MNPETKLKVDEITERWDQEVLPEQVFSGHVKTDIDILLSAIKENENQLDRFQNVVIRGNKIIRDLNTHTEWLRTQLAQSAEEIKKLQDETQIVELRSQLTEALQEVKQATDEAEDLKERFNLEWAKRREAEQEGEKLRSQLASKEPVAKNGEE